MTSPFDINVETVPHEFQLEIMNVQLDENLKSKFRDATRLIKLYLHRHTFPVLRNHARQIISPFGSTYVCQHFLTKIYITKNLIEINDQRSETCLRVATSQTSLRY
jgi:hypothetical protein